MANNNSHPIVHAALFVALSYVLLFIVLPVAGLFIIAYIFASVFKAIGTTPVTVVTTDTTVAKPATAAMPATAAIPATAATVATPTKAATVATPTTAASLQKFTDFTGSEPEWTKRIPNWLICDWFYFFFILNLIVVLALMVTIVGTAMSSSMPKTVRASQLFMMIVQMLASGTSTLFLYVLCDRSLKP
jgi:hypothetical protein